MRRIIGILRLLRDDGGIKRLIAAGVPWVDVLRGLAVWAGELCLDGLVLRGREDALGCEVLQFVLDGVEGAGYACLVVRHFGTVEWRG